MQKGESTMATTYLRTTLLLSTFFLSKQGPHLALLDQRQPKARTVQPKPELFLNGLAWKFWVIVEYFGSSHKKKDSPIEKVKAETGNSQKKKVQVNYISLITEKLQIQMNIISPLLLFVKGKKKSI